jgi:hypothetical protein
MNAEFIANMFLGGMAGPSLTRCMNFIFSQNYFQTASSAWAFSGGSGNQIQDNYYFLGSATNITGWTASIALMPDNILFTATGNSYIWGTRYDGINGISDGPVMLTNYVASNFTPIAGDVKMIPSNNWMYAVTFVSTNAAFQIQP